MNTPETRERPEPWHCGQPMWAAKNRGTEADIPYSAPFWWCSWCDKLVPRQEDQNP